MNRLLVRVNSPLTFPKDAAHTTRFAFAFKTLRLFLMLLLAFWPFLFLGQLLAASLLLFQSRKRLVGLGILTGLAFLVLALLLRLELLPLLLSWPSFGGD
jgi:hypothetical protein